MKTISDIKEILARYKPTLTREYFVREIGVFGSYVRNEQKEGSDIDILVEFEKPVSLLKLIGLENYLKKVIDDKVEVIPKKGIRPELKDNILGEVVYI